MTSVGTADDYAVIPFDVKGGIFLLLLSLARWCLVEIVEFYPMWVDDRLRQKPDQFKVAASVDHMPRQSSSLSHVFLLLYES